MTWRVRVLLAVAIATAAPLMAACGNRWPEENLEAFRRGCLANARRARPTVDESALEGYCDCAASRLQERYTIEEFTALEKQAVSEKRTSNDVLRVVEECGSRLPSGTP